MINQNRNQEEFVAGIVRRVLEESEGEFRRKTTGSEPGVREGMTEQNTRIESAFRETTWNTKNVQTVKASERNTAVHLQPQVTLRLAVALIERIEQRAEELGMRVVTAVSDASGRPVAVHCMDGAYIGSFDVALNKTYTAIAFQMSTAQLGELAAPGQPLYGIQHTNEGKIVIFGGGEPLTAEDLCFQGADPSKLAGAVGVSGGTAEQDTYLAAYARSIVKEVVSCL